MYMFSHMFRSCKNILTFVGWIFEFDGVKFRTLVFLFKLMLVDLQFVFFWTLICFIAEICGSSYCHIHWLPNPNFCSLTLQFRSFWLVHYTMSMYISTLFVA